MNTCSSNFLHMGLLYQGEDIRLALSNLRNLTWVVLPGRNEWVDVFLVCAEHLLLEADGKQSRVPGGGGGGGGTHYMP